MEDIVAVEVRLDTGEKRYFLTWGRIQDTVETELLEELVLKDARRCDLGGVPVSTRVCDTLQEAVSAPYFYESFFDMCQRKIPFGSGYWKWREKINRRMEEGKEIWYLGRPLDMQKGENPTYNTTSYNDGSVRVRGADNF